MTTYTISRGFWFDNGSTTNYTSYDKFVQGLRNAVKTNRTFDVFMNGELIATGDGTGIYAVVNGKRKKVNF